MWLIKKLQRNRRTTVGFSLLLGLLLLFTFSLFGKQISIINKDHNAISFPKDSTKQKYSVVFFDDFNDLDKNVWTFHSQQKPASGGNYKSRFWTNDDNVYVEQGCLVLDCSKTAGEVDGTYTKSNGEIAPVEYYAPYISTCDFLAMTEGRISAKIRVSKGVVDGMFPFCFWTFGQNSSWPYAHEMDIMEGVVGVSTEDKIARNLTFIPAGSHMSAFKTHLFYCTQNTHSSVKDEYLKLNWALYDKGVYDRSIDFINKIDPTEWHVYSVEWNKDIISYLVDENSITSYNAEMLGVLDAEGNNGFLYPQDIRFNIKAGEKTTDQHGYMYIDWVKAESKGKIQCLSISHENVSLKVGGSKYINPTFNIGCSNKAFSVIIKDDGILSYDKYNSDVSQMTIHRIVAKKTGETIVTLHSANGKIVNSFKVTVI